MTSYTVELSKESRKFLKKTDRVTRERVLEAIKKLAVNPYAYEGVKKKQGVDNEYRIKVGDYRIIYALENDVLVIMVLTIGSRGGVYKGS